MSLRRNVARALPVLALLTAAPAAQATVVLSLSVENLADAATHIVTGRVETLAARWRGSLVFTEVEVEVERCYKGPCESTRVQIEVPGGTIDDLVMTVEGMPSFTPGEQVLLFLEADVDLARAPLRTLGLAQGKFSLMADAGSPLALRDLSGISHPGHLDLHDERIEAFDLDALLGRVEASLDR